MYPSSKSFLHIFHLAFLGTHLSVKTFSIISFPLIVFVTKLIGFMFGKSTHAAFVFAEDVEHRNWFSTPAPFAPVATLSMTLASFVLLLILREQLVAFVSHAHYKFLIPIFSICTPPKFLNQCVLSPLAL